MPGRKQGLVRCRYRWVIRAEGWSKSLGKVLLHVSVSMRDASKLDGEVLRVTGRCSGLPMTMQLSDKSCYFDVRSP